MIHHHYLLLLCVGLLQAGPAFSWDVGAAPMMGFNTWNLYGCGVTGDILQSTAQAMKDRGFAAAGYVYVNSDDCWMLAERDGAGNQVANPAKFPKGFNATAEFIHLLGMKSVRFMCRVWVLCVVRCF
jgi:alpha-galactosidase